MSSCIDRISVFYATKLSILQVILKLSFDSVDDSIIRNFSVVDLTCQLKKNASYEDVKATIKYVYSCLLIPFLFLC